MIAEIAENTLEKIKKRAVPRQKLPIIVDIVLISWGTVKTVLRNLFSPSDYIVCRPIPYQPNRLPKLLQLRCPGWICHFGC